VRRTVNTVTAATLETVAELRSEELPRECKTRTQTIEVACVPGASNDNGLMFDSVTDANIKP